MAFYRSHAQVQPAGDSLVAQALRQQRQHFPLALGQRSDLKVREILLVMLAPEQGQRQRRAEIGLSAGHLADGNAEGFGWLIL